MRALIFDAGPIISLATNNLLWVLERLKHAYGGEFLITPKVKAELIDKPLSTKKFEFEALQVLDIIEKDVLKVYQNKGIEALSKELLDLANHSFMAHGSWIRLMHNAEIECLATAQYLKADAAIIDERTTRLFLENPLRLEKLFEIRLHTDIKVNSTAVERVKELLKEVKIIRSSELIMIAYKLGLLNDFIPTLPTIKRPRKTLLNAVLWALKVRGCSISKKEIDEIVRLEK